MRKVFNYFAWLYLFKRQAKESNGFAWYNR